jgi:hypothetical protein
VVVPSSTEETYQGYVEPILPPRLFNPKEQPPQKTNFTALQKVPSQEKRGCVLEHVLLQILIWPKRSISALPH